MSEMVTEDRTSYSYLRVVGELDMGEASAFREAFTLLVERPALVVDLTEVSFMDSAGLGALIGAVRRSRERGAPVAVIATRAAIAGLFATTGVDRLVTMASTLDEAVSSFVVEPSETV